MVKNRQKGITKAYRNGKKDVDTRRGGVVARDGGVFAGGGTRDKRAATHVL